MLYCLIVLSGIVFLILNRQKQEEKKGFNHEFPEADESHEKHPESGARLLEIPLLNDSTLLGMCDEKEECAMRFSNGKNPDEIKGDSARLKIVGQKDMKEDPGQYGSKTKTSSTKKMTASVRKGKSFEKNGEGSENGTEKQRNTLKGKSPEDSLKKREPSQKEKLDERMELIRESYRLAMELSGMEQKSGSTHENTTSGKRFTVRKAGNLKSVSSLDGNISEASFYGTGEESPASDMEETFRFSVLGRQVLSSGSTLLLKLEEDLWVDGMKVLRSSTVHARVRFEVNRIHIEVYFLEARRGRIPVLLRASDESGQEGYAFSGGEGERVLGAMAKGALLGGGTSSATGILSNAIREGASSAKEILREGIDRRRITLEDEMTIYLKNSK